MNDVVFICIWILLIGAVVLLVIKRNIDKKKFKDINMDIDVNWLDNSLSKYDNDSSTHQYYFSFDKHYSAIGHLMEDKKHNIVYEAKFLYNNVIGVDEVDFINHIINYKSHHKIGHTITDSFGNENMKAIIQSSFTFDGKDIYDYLNSLGYSHKINLNGLAYTIDVFNEGEKVGTLYSSNNGKNYFESNGPIKAQIGGKGYMVVETSYRHLDCVFLYALAFARSELSIETFN